MHTKNIRKMVPIAILLFITPKPVAYSPHESGEIFAKHAITASITNIVNGSILVPILLEIALI